MIEITIKGPLRSGKTLIAEEIAAALLRRGVVVTGDGWPIREFEVAPERKLMLSKMRPSVNILQVQADE